MGGQSGEINAPGNPGNPGKPGERPSRAAEAQVNHLESSQYDAARRDYLERALREAIQSADESNLQAEELVALKEVVKRHKGESLSLDPITIEIVSALLSVAFRVPVEKSQTCQDMSRTIARSLWGDSLIRDRVEALWLHLAGTS